MGLKVLAQVRIISLINGSIRSEREVIGWSTTIPSYNPADIVANLRRLMNDEEVVPMLPWWRGFKGEVKKVGEHKYDVTGIAEKVDDTTVRVSELPIHKWTVSFKAELEAMIADGKDGAVKVGILTLELLHILLMRFHRISKNTLITLTWTSSSPCHKRNSRRRRHRASSSISNLRPRSIPAT